MNDKYYTVMEEVKQANKYPIIMHGVNGMLSRPEANWLHRIPKVIEDGTYIDLGTFRGRSACILADTIKQENIKARLVTVDLFDERGISRRFRSDGTISTSGPTKTEVSNKRYEEVKQMFRDKELEVEVLKSHTTSAALYFKPSSVDFLFIDASHDYGSVKADFLAWEDRVNVEGVIAFHDSHREDIVKVHAEIERWEEFDRVDTLSVWRRNA